MFLIDGIKRCCVSVSVSMTTMTCSQLMIVVCVSMLVGWRPYKVFVGMDNVEPNRLLMMTNTNFFFF